ncbi:hypothetical protein [Erythrobacter cryptus]|uniref:hypothetical protein n=1 Tax=Erythrobacter cryptus TaxID=196588 RepID=UPI00041D4D32|nr:hypothetical protein [Erythrobacter cryptus]GIX19626.1 MAG: hypothetical protein KatS3mg120_1302 [Erythrobacter sp.]
MPFLSRAAALVPPLMLALALPGGAHAQAIKSEPPMRTFTAAEIEAVAMPDLAYKPDPAIAADFDKYFFFHRPDTDFSQAYADITECDALASGISFYMGADSAALASAMAQYGVLAGGIGGAIGGLMADAIFGSAERRRIKRINMRNCMFYKGYDRYGLEKDKWQAFHFEEGLSRENAKDREAALLKQARVASGPRPTYEVLEP